MSMDGSVVRVDQWYFPDHHHVRLWFLNCSTTQKYPTVYQLLHLWNEVGGLVCRERDGEIFGEGECIRGKRDTVPLTQNVFRMYSTPGAYLLHCVANEKGCVVFDAYSFLCSLLCVVSAPCVRSSLVRRRQYFVLILPHRLFLPAN